MSIPSVPPTNTRLKVIYLRVAAVHEGTNHGTNDDLYTKYVYKYSEYKKLMDV